MHTLGHFNVKVAHQTHSNPLYSNSVCEAFTRVAIDHLKEGQRRLIGRSLRMLIPLTRNMCVYLLHEAQFCTSCVRSSAMTPGGVFSAEATLGPGVHHIGRASCFCFCYQNTGLKQERPTWHVCALHSTARRTHRTFRRLQAAEGGYHGEGRGGGSGPMSG